MTGSLALSSSGGKDSALALWTQRRDGQEPSALITTVSGFGVTRSEFQRVGAPIRFGTHEEGTAVPITAIPAGQTVYYGDENVIFGAVQPRDFRISVAIGSTPPRYHSDTSFQPSQTSTWKVLQEISHEGRLRPEHPSFKLKHLR